MALRQARRCKDRRRRIGAILLSDLSQQSRAWYPVQGRLSHPLQPFAHVDGDGRPVPLNRLCPIGVGFTQVWGADVVISRDDANSKVGVPGNFLDDLLHASDRPTCRRLDGDPELHVRDRDEIDCRVEGRIEDQLNAGCNRTVRCYCDVPVGLHPILGALTATRKNVLEG